MWMHDTGELSLEDSSYTTLRGWALHRLMPEIIGQPGWVDLRRLSPKSFTALMQDIALRVDCDITPQFAAENPQAMSWIAACYRILFKCLLDDWGMEDVLLVEAELPTISLPDGYELRCGIPDIFGVSEAYQGAVTVELKSGLRRTKKHGSKLARYNGGAQLLVKDLCLDVPYKGTIWTSFSSTKQDKSSGRYYWSAQPVISPEFVPYDEDDVNAILQRKYGVNVGTMFGLPRRYEHSGLSAV